jgi:hypothetical protein
MYGILIYHVCQFSTVCFAWNLASVQRPLILLAAGMGVSRNVAGRMLLADTWLALFTAEKLGCSSLASQRFTYRASAKR